MRIALKCLELEFDVHSTEMHELEFDVHSTEMHGTGI